MWCRSWSFVHYSVFVSVHKEQYSAGGNSHTAGPWIGWEREKKSKHKFTILLFSGCYQVMDDLHLNARWLTLTFVLSLKNGTLLSMNVIIPRAQMHGLQTATVSMSWCPYPAHRSGPPNAVRYAAVMELLSWLPSHGTWEEEPVCKGRMSYVMWRMSYHDDKIFVFLKPRSSVKWLVWVKWFL